MTLKLLPQQNELNPQHNVRPIERVEALPGSLTQPVKQTGPAPVATIHAVGSASRAMDDTPTGRDTLESKGEALTDRLGDTTTAGDNGADARGATVGLVLLVGSPTGVSSELQQETDLLSRFGLDVERAGLVGEKSNAKIVLLSAVSARLEKPLSVSVHGASATGKNHLTETVARFIPDEMKKVLSDMSPKSMMHSAKDEFQHKAVFIAEYAGVAGADFAIRTMQSERLIEWEFVTQEKDRGLVKKRNKVLGPAAFIQATTRPVLHPENETRLVFVQMDETGEQTRAINERQSREAAGLITPPDPRMFAMWHTLVRSLRVTVVVIPFAPSLAEHFPDSRVRSRRDFPKLLGLIEASAFLHQHHRERDTEGRIIASAEDYRIARELFEQSYYAGPDRAVLDLLKAAESLDKQRFEEEGFTAADLVLTTGWGKSKVYEVLSRAEDLGCIVETASRGRYQFVRRSDESPLTLPPEVASD